MKATVFIGLDGSVSTYNMKGVRMPALTGDLTLIHTIVFNSTRPFCKIDETERIVNPDIFIVNNFNNERIKISIDALSNWIKFINKPKAPKSPKKQANLEV